MKTLARSPPGVVRRSAVRAHTERSRCARWGGARRTVRPEALRRYKLRTEGMGPWRSRTQALIRCSSATSILPLGHSRNALHSIWRSRSRSAPFSTGMRGQASLRTRFAELRP